MKIALASASILAAAALTGCYVVPVQPTPVAAQVTPLPPPVAATFAARLYPSNDMAAPYGMVGAIVTNDMNGRGHFTTQIGPESFSGEATRMAGSPREGIANGAGNMGSFLNCRYTMNSPTLGTGNCRLSNGATFTMHVGS
ncbi:hypothetical protein [Ramlibacter sp. PS4R-6]|uniref:hypothetical protein n=1 Tax=Ramlibacter sp. PS4R-6 TaxID=3133438 RepID=UPI0030AF0AB7